MKSRLRLVIGELQQSVEETAKKLNVSHVTLYKYLSGKTKPNVDFLIQLKELTNVNLDWLLTGRGHQYGSKQGNLHKVLLETILSTIFSYISETKANISPQEQSTLAVSLYSLLLKEEGKLDFSSHEVNERIRQLISFKFS